MTEGITPVSDSGVEKPTQKFFKHPTALVESDNIGDDTRIWAYTHILNGAKIGQNTNICDYCFIESKVKIGNDVTIKCGVYLWDGIIVKNKVFIGPSAVFTNDLKPRSKNSNFESLPTTLKKGCSIGANATVLAGKTIGQYAMVGAGTVITKDVPDFALVYGNPAVIKGYVCICGEKMIFEGNISKCKCGKEYGSETDKVVEV